MEQLQEPGLGRAEQASAAAKVKLWARWAVDTAKIIQDKRMLWALHLPRDKVILEDSQIMVWSEVWS